MLRERNVDHTIYPTTEFQTSLLVVYIVVCLQKHEVEVAYVEPSPFHVTVISIDRIRVPNSGRCQLMGIANTAFICAVLK